MSVPFIPLSVLPSSSFDFILYTSVGVLVRKMLPVDYYGQYFSFFCKGREVESKGGNGSSGVPSLLMVTEHGDDFSIFLGRESDERFDG